MKTFKVLSALLSYPTEALIEAAPEFAAVLDAEDWCRRRAAVRSRC
ncbi:hypothetical protein ACQPTN_08525 [Bradyrhizobium sp. 13971]